MLSKEVEVNINEKHKQQSITNIFYVYIYN
jgi:hypothetical protein